MVDNRTWMYSTCNAERVYSSWCTYHSHCQFSHSVNSREDLVSTSLARRARIDCERPYVVPVINPFLDLDSSIGLRLLDNLDST